MTSAPWWAAQLLYHHGDQNQSIVKVDSIDKINISSFCRRYIRMIYIGLDCPNSKEDLKIKSMQDFRWKL